MLRRRGLYVYDTLAPKYLLPVGTRVKIKDYETVEEVHEQDLTFPFSFVEEMQDYCGKIATIKSARMVEDYDGQGMNVGSYRLDIDNFEYKWSDAMFDWSWRSKSKIMMRNE